MGKKVQSSLNLNYENLCLLFVITMKYCTSETKYRKSEFWGWETDFLANVN